MVSQWKDNGVRKRILDINPRAYFVPCNAHSLNLVVDDAAKCCLEATLFFDLVQVYMYISRLQPIAGKCYLATCLA